VELVYEERHCRRWLARFLKAQKDLTIESIKKKYAKELASAEPHQKADIRQRITKEFSRLKNHKPSAGSLW